MKFLSTHCLPSDHLCSVHGVRGHRKEKPSRFRFYNSPRFWIEEQPVFIKISAFSVSCCNDLCIVINVSDLKISENSKSSHSTKALAKPETSFFTERFL
jgi:hypothetical protein